VFKMNDKNSIFKALIIFLLLFILTSGCIGNDNGQKKDPEEQAYEEFMKNKGYPHISGFEVNYMNNSDKLHIGVRTRGEFVVADFKFIQNDNILEKQKVDNSINIFQTSLDLMNFSEKGFNMNEIIDLEFSAKNEKGIETTLKTDLIPLKYLKNPIQGYTFINLFNGYNEENNSNHISVQLRHNDLNDQYSIIGDYEIFDYKGNFITTGDLEFIEKKFSNDYMLFDYEEFAKNGNQYKPFKIIVNRTIKLGNEDVITIVTEVYYCPFASNTRL